MPDRSAPRTGAWLALAALAAAGLLWAFWPQPEPAPATRRNAANGGDSSSLEQTRLVAGGTIGPGEQRTAVAATPAGTSGESQFLRIRLRGLHPDAPWTAPLGLSIDGRDEEKDALLQYAHHGDRPADDGTCTFVLPAWVTSATQQKGRIEAKDPNYMPLEHRWEGSLDVGSEMGLDVQVVAVLEGRVVTMRGEPVAAARVSAFAIRDGKPVDGRLAVANTGDDGLYRVRVAPGVPLLLLATPLEAVQLSGARFHRYDGGIADLGVMRSDLLPAATNILGSVGQATRVPDLVLPDAAHVQGTVRWADGRPVAMATVWIHARDGEPLRISEKASVRPTSTGGFAPGTNATTDDAGRFRLPAQAGVRCRVMVARLDGIEIVGDYITADAMAPQDIDFRVPLPLRLRALHDGTPAPSATIEVEADWPASATGRLRLDPLSTEANGEAHFVTTLPNLHVRATAGSRQSAWTDIATTPSGTVDLELTATLGELAIDFEGDFPVRNAHFDWTRDGGPEGRQHLLRDDSSGPFRLHLAPGRYHLRVTAAGGERNGLFLLPVERDVEVTMAPQNLTFPAQFGGRFTVHATDATGLYVGGSCRVLDASGVGRTERFRTLHQDQSATVGAPGELLAGSPNDYCGLLPAGEYLLEFDFLDHGARQQRVTIKPREVTDVRIRLP